MVYTLIYPLEMLAVSLLRSYQYIQTDPFIPLGLLRFSLRMQIPVGTSHTQRLEHPSIAVPEYRFPPLSGRHKVGNLFPISGVDLIYSRLFEP